MRQIVLDTETTGLDPNQGHRIIEIGCVEIKNRRLTGERFQVYLNPERDIDDGAIQVHGLTMDFLSDKAKFAEIRSQFIQFIKGAELIIHNAPFDVGFIDHELKRLNKESETVENICTIHDTLVFARNKHPGQRNNLDALCKRYEIRNSHRDLHGALLDAEILAEVYLAMTSGQSTLLLNEDAPGRSVAAKKNREKHLNRGPIPVLHANEEELKEHKLRLKEIEKMSAAGSLWLNDGPVPKSI